MLVTARDVETFHRRLIQPERATGIVITARRITLAAAVELACVQHWATSNGCESRLRVESSGAGTWQLLDRSGWPASKSSIELNSDHVGIRVLCSRPGDMDWRPFVYSTRRRLVAAGFSTDSARAIVAAFGEMVNNVWDHSMSDYPGLVAYEVQEKRATFCIADVGVGVLHSLRQNPRFESLKTSNAALNLALKDGVSRFDGQGRGYGFSDLLRGVANQWGIARLRTGEATVVLDHTSEGRTRHSSYAPFLPGLQVAFSCGTGASGGKIVS